MERCPNCNAKNPGNLTCRRCGMDLQVLNHLLDYHDKLIQQGLNSLIDNDLVSAETTFKRACFYKKDSIAEKMLLYIYNEKRVMN